MAESDQDIHDRHAADGNDANGSSNKSEKAQASSKTTQKVRDAHFQEDGVKADGTVPGTEDPTK